MMLGGKIILTKYHYIQFPFMTPLFTTISLPLTAAVITQCVLNEEMIAEIYSLPNVQYDCGRKIYFGSNVCAVFMSNRLPNPLLAMKFS